MREPFLKLVPRRLAEGSMEDTAGGLGRLAALARLECGREMSCQNGTD